jgi:hypothetical protein
VALAVFGNDQEKQRVAGEKLASLRNSAYIATILIGFAGRTKQERVGPKPALFILWEARRPKLSR